MYRIMEAFLRRRRSKWSVKHELWRSRLGTRVPLLLLLLQWHLQGVVAILHLSVAIRHLLAAILPLLGNRPRHLLLASPLPLEIVALVPALASKELLRALFVIRPQPWDVVSMRRRS